MAITDIDTADDGVALEVIAKELEEALNIRVYIAARHYYRPRIHTWHLFKNKDVLKADLGLASRNYYYAIVQIPNGVFQLKVFDNRKRKQSMFHYELADPNFPGNLFADIQKILRKKPPKSPI